MTVLVAGGGIAGLTFALTCHQLGIPVRVFETVQQLQPLGVGINLQPNAVRELIEAGKQIASSTAPNAMGICTIQIGVASCP